METEEDLNAPIDIGPEDESAHEKAQADTRAPPSSTHPQSEPPRRERTIKYKVAQEEIESAKIFTLLGKICTDGGMSAPDAVKWLKMIPSIRFLKNFSGVVQQNVRDSDSTEIEPELVDRLQDVPLATIQSAMTRRVTVKKYITPVNVYEALANIPFCVPKGCKFETKDGQTHLISSFLCGTTRYDVDMTNVDTIYESWRRLIAALERVGSHEIVVAPRNPKWTTLATYCAENFTRPEANGPLETRQKTFPKYLSSDRDLMQVNSDVMFKLLEIVNTISPIYKYEESDKHTWFYVHIWQMSDIRKKQLDGIYDDILSLQLSMADLMRKVKEIFVDERRQNRKAMSEAFKAHTGDPLYEEKIGQLSASAGLYSRGSHIVNRIQDCISCTDVVELPDKVTDQASVISVILSGLEQTRAKRLMVFGTQKPSHLETIRDMKKEPIIEYYIKGEKKIINFLHDVELIWVTSSVEGVDVGITKIGIGEAKDYMTIRDDTGHIPITLAFVFELTAFTGVSDSKIRNTMESLPQVVWNDRRGWNHISYMFRHTTMDAGTYAPAAKTLAARGYSIKLIHHSRMTADETYAFIEPIEKGDANKNIGEVLGYGGSFNGIVISCCKLRDRMTLGAQLDQLNVRNYIDLPYYDYIGLAQNFSWRYNARKRSVPAGKGTGFSDFGDLVGTIELEDTGFAEVDEDEIMAEEERIRKEERRKGGKDEETRKSSEDIEMREGPTLKKRQRENSNSET